MYHYLSGLFLCGMEHGERFGDIHFFLLILLRVFECFQGNNTS